MRRSDYETVKVKKVFGEVLNQMGCESEQMKGLAVEISPPLRQEVRKCAEDGGEVHL